MLETADDETRLAFNDQQSRLDDQQGRKSRSPFLQSVLLDIAVRTRDFCDSFLDAVKKVKTFPLDNDMQEGIPGHPLNNMKQHIKRNPIKVSARLLDDGGCTPHTAYTIETWGFVEVLTPVKIPSNQIQNGVTFSLHDFPSHGHQAGYFKTTSTTTCYPILHKFSSFIGYYWVASVKNLERLEGVLYCAVLNVCQYTQAERLAISRSLTTYYINAMVSTVSSTRCWTIYNMDSANTLSQDIMLARKLPQITRHLELNDWASSESNNATARKKKVCSPLYSIVLMRRHQLGLAILASSR
ncbi:hypothetical protein FB446DRAFT_773612 [Lentinula raphanica]|nr:hypothetical protein FB446DRAFT_773612 [Lentinula raphanica]